MKLHVCRFSRLFAALISMLATHALGQSPATQQTISADPQDWSMYNYDSSGTRWNRGETVLNASNVSKLHEKWRYLTTGDVYATPAVVDNTVYFGDSSGVFYALTSHGQLVWKTKVSGPITASALVTNTMVIFGDQAGYIYGLDRANGSLNWHVHPNPSTIAQIWSSPTWLGTNIVIGIGSSSDLASKAPGFSGSVVRIDLDTGAVRWQTFMVSPSELLNGSSGAGVWDTPTYDPTTGLIYMGTSDSYTSPGSASSDAVLALDAATGAIKWTYQATKGDVSQIDVDFGDSPHIYSLGDRHVIGIGQKTGRFFVLDDATGALVTTPLQVVPECHGSNGLFATAAVAGNKVFAPGQNCKFPFGPIFPPATCQLSSIKSDGSATVWSHVTLFDNAMSGVAVANGVVYYSVVGLTGNLVALDAQTGKTLANVFIGWGAIGPSISRGQVYVGTGTRFASGIDTPASLVALGL